MVDFNSAFIKETIRPQNDGSFDIYILHVCCCQSQKHKEGWYLMRNVWFLRKTMGGKSGYIFKSRYKKKERRLSYQQASKTVLCNCGETKCFLGN